MTVRCHAHIRPSSKTMGASRHKDGVPRSSASQLGPDDPPVAARRSSIPPSSSLDDNYAVRSNMGNPTVQSGVCDPDTFSHVL